jgi:acyl-CoA dehydrogenase family protein 9
MDEQQRRMAEELLFGEEKKPSFAKQLFKGAFDAPQVFPFPLPTEDSLQRESDFLTRVQDFVDREIDPVWIDRHAEIPESVIRGLGRLGVLGMTIPPEHGGLGMTQHAYCKAVELVARRCGSTALFINAHQSIGLKALLLFGTREQQARWLAPLARGEQIAAFSLTEPMAGSDASGVQTTARYDPAKDAYYITGQKQWTTNGSIAHVLTVMAQTDVETALGTSQKITAFLVTPDMPGFKVAAPSLEKLGMRGTKTANLEFNEMEVPASHILGLKGGGLKLCLTVLDYGRTTFGATCTGAAKTVVELATRHAMERKQFQRPLASFGLVKKKLATMAALVYAMDATTYMTAGFADRNAEDFMLESAILKVFASDSLWDILYDAMQILGGRSFFTDKPYERMMRDARLNMIGEGANEVMRVFIGVVGLRDRALQMQETAGVFGAPLSKSGAAWRFAHDVLRQMKRPAVPVHSSILRQEAEELGAWVRRFGFAVMRMIVRYKESIVERQMTVNRLATAAIAMYTSTAVLSKIDHALSQGSSRVPTLETDLLAAKTYCRLAFDRIGEELAGLSRNNDELLESVSDRITRIDKSAFI